MFAGIMIDVSHSMYQAGIMNNLLDSLLNLEDVSGPRRLGWYYVMHFPPYPPNVIVRASYFVDIRWRRVVDHIRNLRFAMRKGLPYTNPLSAIAGGLEENKRVVDLAGLVTVVVISDFQVTSGLRRAGEYVERVRRVVGSKGFRLYMVVVGKPNDAGEQVLKIVEKEFGAKIVEEDPLFVDRVLRGIFIDGRL